MQWVIIFTVFATAYSASVRSGEKPIVCLNRDAGACIQKIAMSLTTDFSYCRIIPDAAKCYEDAAKGCGVDLQEHKNVADFISVLRDVCKPGTELNEQRLKHQDCLIKTFYNTEMRSCVEDMTEEISKLTPPDFTNPEESLEYNNKIQKIACRHIDSMTTCIYDSVRTGCGNDAVSFVKTFYEPSTSITREFCEQSGYIF